MLIVQTLVAKDHDKHLGESEAASACHVVLQFFLHRLHVGLVFQFDKVGLPNLDLELTGRFYNALIHIVRSVVVAAAV